MMQNLAKIKNRIDRFAPLFSWLRFFYPSAKGIHLIYLLYFIVPQKLLRINGSIPWPVHFTSRILFHKNIKIGNRSAPGMNAHSYVQARNGISIGSNFRMGPGVGLISANHKEDDYDIHLETSPIIIGDNVWIGMNSVVLPGIRIGSNVMIGANSLVTKNIPSNVVAAGNPCQVIRDKKPYCGTDYTKL
ncbi:MAG: acyltransferase [Desulfobacula sp.]|nr:acyltransferase [Desulfobacula sp.]